MRIFLLHLNRCYIKLGNYNGDFGFTDPIITCFKYKFHSNLLFNFFLSILCNFFSLSILCNFFSSLFYVIFSLFVLCNIFYADGDVVLQIDKKKLWEQSYSLVVL